MSDMNMFGAFCGIRIFDNEMLGDPFEDWSGVRSKGRAARRRKQGHPQRIVTRFRANGKCIHDKMHNVIYMHPHDRIRFEQTMRHRS